jgi:hypothetical protein
VDDAIMNAFRSIEVKTDFSGVDADIATYKGLDFLAPIAPGSGSDIVVYNTVDFADQGGVKATYSRLMHFAAQSDPGSHSTPQERHNIIHEGFNWNDGHFVAGDWELGTDGDHLWRDQTDEVWRSFTDGDGPTGESAGVAFVTGTNADTHGPMFWGDADNASFDQGTEVCEAIGVGLTCVQAMEADGTEIASCATVATGSASGFFYALCK